MFADLRTVESHGGDKPYPNLLGLSSRVPGLDVRGVMSETSLQPNSPEPNGVEWMGRIMQGTAPQLTMLGDSCRPRGQNSPTWERLFQNMRAWGGGVLALIVDHRHRGNLHIKAWPLAGPWRMLQEVMVPGRQACIGTYHEPYQEACQGATRRGSRRRSLLGSTSL